MRHVFLLITKFLNVYVNQPVRSIEKFRNFHSRGIIGACVEFDT